MSPYTLKSSLCQIIRQIANKLKPDSETVGHILIKDC